ncbi:MAG: hypothetical protein WCL44_09760, partial [bacterium]
VPDQECSEGSFARLPAAGSSLKTQARGMVDAPEARWLVRVRGKGTVDAGIVTRDGVTLKEERLVSASDDWQWLSCNVPPLPGYGVAGLSLVCVDGGVDVDTILLAGGAWSSRLDGAGVHIAPPCFFHAGYSRLDTDAVVIRRLWQPDSNIFYGPRLPLDKGAYAAVLRFGTSAPAGTLLGRWRAQVGGVDAAVIDVTSGIECAMVFDVKQNTPLVLSFEFSGKADMEIRDVWLMARAAARDGAAAAK